ncbi:hypothetical protein ABZ342_39530 [Amycolatopsis sp. NPDC005961]|uniref:hypothetical protein n=1 Tax=Amycolatopsis sp. NPDC005961 TaxID=3156720 RepID=UPI003401B89B
MKRFVTAVVLSLTGLFAGAGVASADVIVPPEQFGHVCSGYQYVPSNHGLYWQSCAWADNNEVYFTVHFGNATDVTWAVTEVNIGFYKSGGYTQCTPIPSFYVSPHSVRQTPSNACWRTRARAAYQSVGYPNSSAWAISDTLQVQ